ncbi:MAG TPA: amino acid racemase [Patescibacteria group bacterium]|nr:amino acid racemase [Patescibacteria group bacterium]
MRNPIVILGGMGPQASLRFHQLLIEKSMKHHHGDGQDFPHIVHFSLPIADFISNEDAEQAAVLRLRHLATTIRTLQPQQITLACNTAHLLTKEVDFLQTPTFVSMLAIMAQKLRQDNVRKIGLIASPTTIRTGLYRVELHKMGMELLIPQAKQLTRVEMAIRATISGSVTTLDKDSLLDTARALAAQGAEAIVLGCTELPLIFPMEKSPIPVYDCLDIYANAVIARYYLYNRSTQ